MKAVLCILGFLLFAKLLPGLIIVGVIYFLLYGFIRAIFAKSDGQSHGGGSSSDDVGSGWSGTGNPHV